MTLYTNIPNDNGKPEIRGTYATAVEAETASKGYIHWEHGQHLPDWLAVAVPVFFEVKEGEVKEGEVNE
jgi:hypothetical protein